MPEFELTLRFNVYGNNYREAKTKIKETLDELGVEAHTIEVVPRLDIAVGKDKTSVSVNYWDVCVTNKVQQGWVLALKEDLDDTIQHTFGGHPIIDDYKP